jgi:hypothetical protein
MTPDYTAALPDAVPERIVVPVLLVGLLVLTAVALATGQETVGVVGVFMLSILSVSYGAVLRPEEML